MPRPAPSLGSVAADLARHAAGARPAGVSAATWRRLLALAEGLRTDARATIATEGAVRAAEALSVARDTLRLWRADGWLADAQGEPWLTPPASDRLARAGGLAPRGAGRRRRLR